MEDYKFPYSSISGNFRPLVEEYTVRCRDFSVGKYYFAKYNHSIPKPLQNLENYTNGRDYWARNGKEDPW